MNHVNILDSSKSLVVVIDVQDPLLRVIYEGDQMVANSIKLIETAKIFDIPILVPLQNYARLGDVTQPIADVLGFEKRFDKMTFSCFGSTEFVQALEETQRTQIILCGIETHVCVNQTAHDLLARGYNVHVVKDATSSRRQSDWKTGIEKMRDAGCVACSTEMVIFELVRDASRPEFKRILPIVK